MIKHILYIISIFKSNFFLLLAEIYNNNLAEKLVFLIIRQGRNSMNTLGINNKIQLIDKKEKQIDISNANVSLTKHGIINKNHGKKINNIDFRKKDFIYSQKNLTDPYIKKEDKAEEVKDSALEKWDKLIQRFGVEDLELLSKEGMNYKEYDVGQLDKTIERIKEERAIKKENLENQIEANKEKIDLIRSSYGGGKLDKKIIQRLEDKGLPVTKGNIEKISNALEKAIMTENLSDQAISYLTSYDMPLTIENIYKSMHISYDNKQNIDRQGNSYSDFESIERQVLKTIQDSKLEVNDENIDNAKWLLENDIPITEKSLWKLKDLKIIKSEMTQDEILNRIVSNIEEGIPLEKTNLTLVSYNRLDDIIDEFQNIDDLTLDFAFEQDADIDIDTISLRRNLEEIRLKLTISSGKQLIKNGFNLETDKLSRIVDGLREIENKYYQNLLEEQSLPVTLEKVSYLESVLTSLDELRSMPVIILGSTLASMETQTIVGLIEEGNNQIANRQLANKTYETLMTKPDRYYGDKIEKAFTNIDEILTSLELEVSEANQRAVRILGYNSMDITRESIKSIKAYDNQVDYMMKNLLPSTVVSFIKKDLNPLNMPITDINKEIKDERLNTESLQNNKFSKYLWKLEKNQEISENEKESYIGFYRLIHQLNKNGEAALGAVINAGQEVTLSNLLTAMRTRSHGEIDLILDEEFGALEDFSKGIKDIDVQINEGFIDNIFEEISPEKIHSLEGKEIYDMSIEQLSKQLKQTQNEASLDKDYFSEQISKTQDLVENNPDIIKYLESLKIPVSINNIRAATGQLSQDQNVYKLIKDIDKESQLLNNNTLKELDIEEISNRVINNFNSYDDLSKEYENIEKDINDICKDLFENKIFSLKEARSLQRITSGMSFVKLLSKKEHYQIPIVKGETVTNVNLTILRNEDKRGRIKINLFSETLGSVVANFKVDNKELTGFISSNNMEGLEVLKAAKDEMIERLEKQGISCKAIYYSNNQGNAIYNNKEENKKNSEEQTKEDTQTLYKISKEILLHIGDMETDKSF